MRNAVVMGLLVVAMAGCQKKKPSHLSSWRVAFPKSPAEPVVTLGVAASDSTSFALPGTLAVSLHWDRREAPTCAGSVKVTAASYVDDVAVVTVPLTGCPPLPHTVDRDVHVVFTPDDPDAVAASDDEEAFSQWLSPSQLEIPDEPEVAARKQLAKAALDACVAKDTKRAAALRAQVAPKITAAVASLPAFTQHALTLLAASADPCHNGLDVYATVSDPFGPAFEAHGLDETEDFKRAVQAAGWPTTEIVEAAVARLDGLGQGWIEVRADRPSSDGASLELAFDPHWSDSVEISAGVLFPRLRISGVAHLRVPGQPDETLSLGELAFEPANQEVKFRAGEEAAAVAHRMVGELAPKLSADALFATPAPSR